MQEGGEGVRVNRLLAPHSNETDSQDPSHNLIPNENLGTNSLTLAFEKIQQLKDKAAIIMGL